MKPALALSRAEPIAVGHLRYVFAHPEQADWLVKVMRPDAVAKRWNAPGRWHKRLARTRQYASFLREIKEYIAVQACHPGGDVPIARPCGIVETDFGLGLEMEKVLDNDGRLAPTLRDLLRRKSPPPDLERELDRLFADLQRFDVILGDLHAGNVVYGSDTRGGPRLILIDGFGEKNLIPRCSMSRAFNHWHNRLLFKRLMREIGRLRKGEAK